MSKDLEQTISALSERVEGDVGVCAQTLCGSRRVAVNAGDRYPTASSVKMFILYTLLYETDRHRVSLAERIDYQPRFSTPGSGVMSHLDPGLRPTLKDLATLMMMISDNTATNILIDYLGLGRVNEAISDIPVENTRIGSWSNFKESDRDSFSLGESTPEAFTDFLLKMRTGALLSPQLTELFWDMLRIQKYIEPLRKYLPASPWAREWGDPEPVWVASKCGHLIDCTTESGIVHAHGTEWAVSIMTRDMPEESELPNEPGEELISDISLSIFRAWAPSPVPH